MAMGVLLGVLLLPTLFLLDTENQNEDDDDDDVPGL